MLAEIPGIDDGQRPPGEDDIAAEHETPSGRFTKNTDQRAVESATDGLQAGRGQDAQAGERGKEKGGGRCRPAPRQRHRRRAVTRALPPGKGGPGWAILGSVHGSPSLVHDPEKWEPVFGKDHAPRTG